MRDTIFPTKVLRLTVPWIFTPFRYPFTSGIPLLVDKGCQSQILGCRI
jgi:hypothetical protein